MPTTGCHEVKRSRRAKEPGVAEREHAAIGGDQPVALAVRGGRHAHHRREQRSTPMDPTYGASPKLNTPPSAATTQYPLPTGSEAMATAGASSVIPLKPPSEGASP